VEIKTEDENEDETRKMKIYGRWRLSKNEETVKDETIN